MNELVGYCEKCKKHLYCLDGFFDAEIVESGKIYCLDCYDKVKKESDE
jgi:hypothetical protein